MAIAKARGARVVAIEAVDQRLAEARKFGAYETIDMRQNPDLDDRIKLTREVCGGFPDVVIEVAGVPQAFVDAIRLVGAGGRVLEIGNISASLTVPFPPSMITTKSIEVIGTAMYPPHYLKKSLDV